MAMPNFLTEALSINISLEKFQLPINLITLKLFDLKQFVIHSNTALPVHFSWPLLGRAYCKVCFEMQKIQQPVD